MNQGIFSHILILLMFDDPVIRRGQFGINREIFQKNRKFRWRFELGEFYLGQTIEKNRGKFYGFILDFYWDDPSKPLKKSPTKTDHSPNPNRSLSLPKKRSLIKYISRKNVVFLSIFYCFVYFSFIYFLFYFFLCLMLICLMYILK